MDGWVDGWRDRHEWMKGQMHGWMGGGWMDGQMHRDRQMDSFLLRNWLT